MIYTVSDKLGSNLFIIDPRISWGPKIVIIPNDSYSSAAYSRSNSYTRESLFDMHDTSYFLISINNYQNNIFISPFQ